ncbi:MAG: helix-turn-helix domain-containing protein [Phocaeicola sp.]
MTNNTLFNFIKLNKKIEVVIDTTKKLAETFEFPEQIPAYLFILCDQGLCKISTHLSTHTLKSNSFITILPNSYVQVLEQSDDCHLYLIGFHKELLNNTSSFSVVMECVHSILQAPVLTLKSDVSLLIKEYILLLQKAIHTEAFKMNIALASTQLLSIFHGISRCYETNQPKNKLFNRAEEIVKELTKHMIKHYKEQRNVTFYANLLHISPQHLSTTISKVTGQTVTEVIAKLVITDACAKLKSSDMSIQEIAYSLNFSDISLFGKYFKRYMGKSPRQYRDEKEEE